MVHQSRACTTVGRLPGKGTRRLSVLCLVRPPPWPPIISQVIQGLGRGQKYPPSRLCPMEGHMRSGKALSQQRLWSMRWETINAGGVCQSVPDSYQACSRHPVGRDSCLFSSWDVAVQQSPHRCDVSLTPSSVPASPSLAGANGVLTGTTNKSESLLKFLCRLF